MLYSVRNAEILDLIFNLEQEISDDLSGKNINYCFNYLNTNMETKLFKFLVSGDVGLEWCKLSLSCFDKQLILIARQII